MEEDGGGRKDSAERRGGSQEGCRFMFGGGEETREDNVRGDAGRGDNWGKR